MSSAKNSAGSRPPSQMSVRRSEAQPESMRIPRTSQERTGSRTSTRSFKSSVISERNMKGQNIEAYNLLLQILHISEKIDDCVERMLRQYSRRSPLNPQDYERTSARGERLEEDLETMELNLKKLKKVVEGSNSQELKTSANTNLNKLSKLNNTEARRVLTWVCRRANDLAVSANDLYNDHFTSSRPAKAK